MPAHARPTIVGFDGSPAALAALPRAIDQAGPDGHLVIIHAFTTPTAYDPLAYGLMLEAVRDESDRLLADLPALEPRLAEISWESRAMTGPAALVLTEVAEKEHADAIVIGSRGRGYVHALLGSVAYETIHLSRCPVTVVPAPTASEATDMAAAVATAGSRS